MALTVLFVFAGIALAEDKWTTDGDNNIYNANTGNVGIGTTEPSVKLHVIGPDVTSSTGWKSEIIAGAANNYQSQRVGLGLDASGPRSGIGLMWNGNTLFKVDNIGNVGIGTTSPGSKLEIYNRVTDQNQHSLFKINYGNWVARQLDFGIDSNRVFIDVTRPGDGSVAELSLNPSGGKVGIGTTIPGANLDVNGNAIIGAAANSDTTIPLRLNGLAVSDGANPYGNYGGILFDVNSAYTASARRYLITNALAINKFGIIRSADAYKDPTIGKAGAITSGTADFVIDNNGKVGIGTTSPGAKLDIYGSNGAGNKVDGLVEIRNTSDGGGLIVKSTGTYPHTDRGPFQVYYDDGNIPIITTQNNGNVGIGTTNPRAKLDVNGNASIGAAANTDTTIPLRLGGLAVSAGDRQYGNYGGILLDVNSAYTASARRYLITNALAINKFGIIRSVDAYKDPTIGKAGAITSGTADFVIDNTGNVGIGASDPATKLEVAGVGNSIIYARTTNISSADAGIKIRGARNSCPSCDTAYIDLSDWDSNEGAGTDFAMARISGGMQDSSGQTGYLRFYTNSGSGLGEHMRIDKYGKVGIGTTSPGRRLSVYESSSPTIQVINSETGSTISDGGYLQMSGSNLLLGNQEMSDLVLFVDNDASKGLRVTSGGNVGIGTTSPQSKLAVNGTITAKEIKVESGWADFVFDEDYDLASLDEVDLFIRKNKHLPDIPSAKEVAKHGLAVSEILAKQMQKIEEMTLYLIELKKGNKALKAKNAELERRLADLEAGR